MNISVIFYLSSFGHLLGNLYSTKYVLIQQRHTNIVIFLSFKTQRLNFTFISKKSHFIKIKFILRSNAAFKILSYSRFSLPIAFALNGDVMLFHLARKLNTEITRSRDLIFLPFGDTVNNVVELLKAFSFNLILIFLIFSEVIHILKVLLIY